MTALEQAERWFLGRGPSVVATATPDRGTPQSRDLGTPHHVTRSVTDGGGGGDGDGGGSDPCARKRGRGQGAAGRQRWTLNASGSPAKTARHLPDVAGSARRGQAAKYAGYAAACGQKRLQPRYHVSQPALCQHGEANGAAALSDELPHTAGTSLPLGMDNAGDDRPPATGRAHPDPDPGALPAIGRSSRPDPASATRRSAGERSVQREVDQNWILNDQLRDMRKQFERRRNHLTIPVADEDPMVVIERRLEEIRQMAAGKATKRNVLDRFHPDVRTMILKYKDIPVQQIKDIKRKKTPKTLDRFRSSVTLVMLLLRGFHGRTRYFADQSDTGQLRKKAGTAAVSQRVIASGRASIAYELRLALTTQPHLRKRKSIKQILWVLRATKAFKHLFPTEMEEELAKNVAYERYDDGRVISWQGRAPDRFYYIISGRVNLLRQYQLSTGHVTKSMGFLSKGMTTDPQEIDKQWRREESLVSKGQVEVLLLDKQSFRSLQHTTDGAPVEFLQSLHLFQEFPLDRFINNPDTVEVKYYGAGKTIVKDSNRTPWLHVVKSGLVKVVRRQSVIDVRLSNESKFSAPTVERLGCGKAFSHADAMLGIQAKQKKLKAFREGLLLPQIGANTYNMSANPLGGTLGIPSPAVYRQPNSTVSKATKPDEEDDTGDEEDEEVAEHNDVKEKTHSDHGSEDKSEQAMSTNLLQVADFEPHDLWLTREKTGNEVLFPRIKQKEVHHRRAYLQLDVLKTGDVFGLDHMQPALASEPVGVSLLSDGAEIVKISKRFFLQNADNNTMLKVETMYKEYLSEKDAEQALYQQETWDQYKAALWSRMTANKPHLAAHDR